MNSKKPDYDEIDDNVHERVRQMMEPDDSTPRPKKIKILHDGAPTDTPGTAPELGEMPVPKEPLKIKILKDEPPAEEIPPQKPEKAVPAAVKPSPKTEDEPEEFSDPQTAKAVDDIVAHESDQLLAAEDSKLLAAVPSDKKPSFVARLRAFLGASRTRKAVIMGGFLTVLAIMIVPPSRYFTLNAAGVRSSASVDVRDQGTQQPLKNVRVTIGTVSVLTDGEGHAKLEKIKLGRQQFKIEKRAFGTVDRRVTIGWGSNPMGEYKLDPTGTQYVFVLTDFLSGKPIPKVEAISDEANAVSDEKGKLVLTMDKPPDAIEVTLQGKTYREEKLTIDADTKDETNVMLVPARKHAFVSKRSGKYDVYKTDIDGKNEQLVLAGSGSERDDIALVSHPTKEVAVLVSTREGKRNKDNYLLSNLTVINLEDNTAKSIALSERIQVLGWADGRLVYVAIASGASAADPKRQRLVSYDSETEGNKELASSNSFNDVMIMANKVYYSPSSAFQANNPNVGLFKVDANGANRQNLIGKEIWNIFRTSYDHLILTAQSESYDYQLGSKEAIKQSSQAGTLVSRVYIDSPDSKKSLWVDTRDGKGVLLSYTLDVKQDKQLHSQSGLKNPIRWLTDNAVIYRINTEQETADYAISVNGGQPKKIKDVTNTIGLDRWYYY